MKKSFALAAFAGLLVAPAAAPAQTMMMSGPGIAMHAYDWMLGTWTCKNAVPSMLAGPAVQTMTATRSATTAAIVWRYTGTNYDQYGFLSYAPRTKTWWYSWAYPGGSTGNESSRQTGRKTMWTGTIFDASTGKTFRIRDTYTVYSPTRFNDFGQDDQSGSWKTGYNGTCTKS